MKNVLLTFALLLTFGLSYGQIKVHTSGDTGLGMNNSNTPRAVLDIPEHTTDRSTAQVGMFGIQSFNDTNGFLAGNSFWNGGGMELRTAGSVGMLQFTSTRVTFRTSAAGAAGSTTTNSALQNNIVAQDDGRVGINMANGALAPAYDLHVNGNAGKTSGGADWVVISDKRLKKNIKKYTAGLEEIMKLNTVTFEYTGEAGTKANETNVGLIAQEMQEIAPYCVKKYTFVPSSLRDDMTETKEPAQEYLSLDNSAVRWMLVNAVQEQQAQIDTKDAQIDALTDRLDALETVIMNLSNTATTTQAVEIRDSRLGQNAPNPFTQATVINYAVPTKAQTAVMQVFDMNGQLLKSVNVANGNGQLTINAGELAAGTYSYNLVVDGKVVDTKKMVLTK